MKQKNKNLDTARAEAIIARIRLKGGWENPLGIPGWRWFQFDTNIDKRNWFVSDGGKIKAGECFMKAKEIQDEK